MAEPYAVREPLCQYRSYRLSRLSDEVDLPQMEETFIDRIEKRLAALDLTASKASQMAGLSKDAIRNWQRRAHVLPLSRSLVALANVLQTSTQWLLTGSDDLSSEDVSNDLDNGDAYGMQYGGIVEAGTFRSVDILDQSSERKRVAMPYHPHFPIDKQYAYRVQGDSMNAAKIEEGMWVTAIDFETWLERYKELRDDTPIVAMRTRAGNAEQELAVKVIRFFADRIELQPQSTNPEHKPIILPRSKIENDGLVSIIAVVYWAGWDMMQKWK